jgi:uncharacterized repeat protein (TIGR04138 family)
MSEKKPSKSIETIFSEDGRYLLPAVQFVREGLSTAVNKLQDGSGASYERRHVSGAELCRCLREMAQQRWGLLARQVLAHWGITATCDFGEIVFLLVDNGWMQKEPTDTIEDFDDVYDFIEAFDRDFSISLDK